MSQCNLNVNHLRAALICAAKNDARYYLNGVLALIRKRDVLLVSTDGYRLSVIHRAHKENEPDSDPAELILPREALKGIKACGRHIADCVLHYNAKNPLAECKLDMLKDGGRTFKPIDGKYPDWRRVVPDKASGEPAHFDPYFVADFSDMARILTGNGRTFADLRMNGESAALVTCEGAPEFLGALMPMRWSVGDYKRPDWLTMQETTEEPAKLRAVA